VIAWGKEAVVGRLGRRPGKGRRRLGRGHRMRSSIRPESPPRGQIGILFCLCHRPLRWGRTPGVSRGGGRTGSLSGNKNDVLHPSARGPKEDKEGPASRYLPSDIWKRVFLLGNLWYDMHIIINS